jgi:hypothetical protein
MLQIQVYHVEFYSQGVKRQIKGLVRVQNQLQFSRDIYYVLHRWLRRSSLLLLLCYYNRGLLFLYFFRFIRIASFYFLAVNHSFQIINRVCFIRDFLVQKNAFVGIPVHSQIVERQQFIDRNIDVLAFRPINERLLPRFVCGLDDYIG